MAGMMLTDVDGLADAIRREHEAAGNAARSALDHALEAGRLLAQAREGIPHGGWESFVRDRCGVAPRTARLYLRLDANRERLADRQRVAGLTVREAAQVLAEPKVEPLAPNVDYLGPHWIRLSPTACEFNPEWSLEVPHATEFNLKPPRWFVPECSHYGEHSSGWCFEISPSSLATGRVNAVVHDPSGLVHMASFDGMTPAGILPFMTSCSRHHAMPEQGEGWSITTVPGQAKFARLDTPFPFKAFDLGLRRGHCCYCWPFVDEAIGLAQGEGDPGHRAWLMLGRALAVFVKGGAA